MFYVRFCDLFDVLVFLLYIIWAKYLCWNLLALTLPLRPLGEDNVFSDIVLIRPNVNKLLISM